MTIKEKLITKIVESELEMFQSVPADRNYNCQQDPAGFRLHRQAQFTIWSEDALRSYRNDLDQAEEDGVNLMTIKYGRMQNIIPGENLNPLIDKIIAVQLEWQAEMMRQYPNLMAGARRLAQSEDSEDAVSFETYLRGELETYSDATLALLHRDVLDYAQAGVNGSEKIYDHLVKEMGFDSLTAADRAQT